MKWVVIYAKGTGKKIGKKQYKATIDAINEATAIWKFKLSYRRTTVIKIKKAGN